ncbi:DEAD/DEAH box helicase [Teredinibacter haidensis]|uniref:DEAD/DEAH box helicase n=1 Tax=Teredinibacter haidensis TaxID=2731755 RepID=UPI000948DA4F|nr:DEAD/DEAH box helicase [Teredinibacter haidensis]
MIFSELGLSESIVKAVAEQGYETPTPIQAQAIPAVLEGRDVMAAAQTGTGKTAGFTLPILHQLSKGEPTRGNQVRALILTPTRELAAQVAESVQTYSKYLPKIRAEVVFGGVKINPQMMRLRRGADILVATPGRLMDLFQQNAVKFNHLEILVLDEADRMLDMGFIHDIKKILAVLPAKRQNLLFSATFSDEIRTLAKGLIHNPAEFSVTPRNATATTVKQWIHPVDKKRKPALLSYLIGHNNWQQVLVFTRTKHGANKLTRYLEDAGLKAAAIHGNKSQNARTKALADFKQNKIRILVATDIAARGLDIDQLPQVVNFDLPNVSEDYVHRIGRTGRAGASGQAVSLVSADEFDCLAGIERLTKKLIPREYVDDFYPVHELPESKLDLRPIRAKKPKKPNAGHRDGQRSGEVARGHKPSTNSSSRKRAGGRTAGEHKNTAKGDNPGARNSGSTSAGDNQNIYAGPKAGNTSRGGRSQNSSQSNRGGNR